MNNIWEQQRFQAGSDLIAGAAEVGHRMRENSAVRKQEAALQTEYAKALASAKQTGVMPDHLQKTVPVDYYGKHYGVRAVTLRELGKVVPAHPLVKSPECREMIGLLTLQKYNQDNRPDTLDFAKYTVDDNVAQAVFARHKG